MRSGVFPIESLTLSFTDVNECADETSNCSADAACNCTRGSYGLAKVKQSPVSESNVKSVLVLKLIAVTTF